MADEGVSYEALQELVRQERRSNKLTPVADTFWAELRTFLADIEEEFRAAQQVDPFDRRVMMLTDRVKNARHAAESLWTLRERKLAMIALAHVRDGGRPKRLTTAEARVYDAMVMTLQAGRDEVFEGALGEGPTQAPEPAKPREVLPPDAATRRDAKAAGAVQREREERSDAVEPADEADDAAEGEADEMAPPVVAPVVQPPLAVPADAPSDGAVTIRALGEIPAFVGPDMETYHLQQGDVASVPQNIADLLVRRNMAAVIELA